MAEDEELKPFKISDMRRPEVRGGPGGAAAPSEDAGDGSATTGFDRVEAQIDAGGLEDVVARFQPRYQALEALLESGDRKQKAAAKKAMIAYERVVDLFEFLYSVRASMAEAGAPEASAAPVDEG